MTWFPGWSWLSTPSGRPFTETGFWPRLVRRLGDSPILAHPLGMLIAAAVFTAVVRLGILPLIVWCACTSLGVLSQWWKNHHERYGTPWGAEAWKEMTRRLVIEQVVVIAGLLAAVKIGWL